MQFRLEGMYASMITPFTCKGIVDADGLRASVDFLVENEVHGVLCLGGTGEVVCLSRNEREEVMDIVIDQVNSRVPVVVGAIEISTAQVAKLGKEAENAGADAVMIVPPYFVYSTLESVFKHCKTIAETIDLPMILFHTPKRSGVTLNLDTIVKILEIDNFVGIKDSSRDLVLLQELRKASKGASILTGLDELVFATLAVGGDGAIITGVNLLPEKWVDLFNEFRRGGIQKAREIQFELMPLIRALGIEPNPTPVKTALNLIGRPAGPVRAPLLPMSDENKEKLKNAMISSGLL